MRALPMATISFHFLRLPIRHAIVSHTLHRILTTCIEWKRTKKAIVDSSLFLVVDSVAAENELRKRPCHAERILHMMEEKDEVVMAKPFRGRVLWPAEKYAFCTQASKALAPVSRGPLGAEDKVECWVAIHVAKHFRAHTPDEHAAFVASKDREKATRKLHDADKKRGAKAKKHKATTATGALE